MAVPVLWQDWDEEAEEKSAQYWELFTDLLMVAAASAIADIFKEQQDLHGFAEFALFYLLIMNGWLLCTHHFMSRFHEASLLHSCILFFFLLGMASSIVNVGYDRAREFSLSAALQRWAFLTMMLPVSIYIPRARAFSAVFCGMAGVGLVCFVMAAIWPAAAPYIWWIIAIMELNMEFISTAFLPGPVLVPVNIEHTKDRLGVLVLVMLGETVISVTVFRERDNQEESSHCYSVVALSFLLIFMFTLLFFNMQPAPKDHALRRSRFHGSLTMVLNKILGLALLAVGVGIKLVVEAVSAKEPLSPFCSHLLGVSVGCSLIILFLMRACHYGGVLPRPNDPPEVRRLMWIWWWIFGLSGLVPFFFLNCASPIWSLAIYSGLLMVLCVTDSSFTHILEKFLYTTETETEPLNQSSPTLYDTNTQKP